MRLLVGLRLFEAVAGVGPVGAAVLFVRVEKEFVELVLQVVMMRDVLPRALEVVGGQEALDRSRRLALRQSLAALAHHNQKRARKNVARSEEHTSELQSHVNIVCRLLL